MYYTSSGWFTKDFIDISCIIIVLGLAIFLKEMMSDWMLHKIYIKNFMKK